MKNAGSTLKASIEDCASRLRNQSPLGQVVRAGQLTPQALALYLTSLRHLFEHSFPHLKMAADLAAESGSPELAKYLMQRAHEERGHDAWANSDLAQLPESLTKDLQPAAAVVKLLELQRVLIAKHPLCFVAYFIWAEYLTVLLGDEWLEALAKYGYDRSKLSAVAKHLDADREHAAEGFTELDRLWHGEPELQTLVEAVEQAHRVFEEFCDEICAEARRAA
jgi:hypothetical protein